MYNTVFGIPRRFISVDDHVLESPRVWLDRLSATRWGDRIPHLVEQGDGTHAWQIDGDLVPLRSIARTTAALSGATTSAARWEDVPRPTYLPAERLLAMDADGVGTSVLYPTVAGMAGETFGRIKDPALELACVQAYNDWLIDEWVASSPRFVPQCIVPLFPVETTIAEITRAVERGHRAVIFPALPMFLREVPNIDEPAYDPVWSVCEELGVPICFHAGSTRVVQFPPYPGFSAELTSAFESITRPFSSALVIANLLLSQVLQRHPRLQVIFAEDSVGWGVFCLETMDYLVHVDRLDRDTYAVMPSDVFRRQCYFTGGYESLTPEACSYLGTDRILWSANFPLSVSTWPNTAAYLLRSFHGVPELAREQILWRNAAEAYRLPLMWDSKREDITDRVLEVA